MSLKGLKLSKSEKYDLGVLFATILPFLSFQLRRIVTYPLTFATVKFSAFILAVIVLWFSSMPCKDDLAFGNSAKSAIELAKSTQNDHQDNQSADACTPFCTCSCCAGVSFKVPLFSIPKIAFNNSSKNSFYISTEIAEISLPVWQPPQLVA
jgi:hypothetical protein